MRPLKLIRKLFQVLKSQASPAQIALGLCLGALIGLTPLGWITLALFSLTLVFNVSLGGVSLGAAAFKLLYFPLRPLAHSLGYALLEGHPGWDPLWSHLFYAPGLAWLGLNRYLVLGGLALGLAVSLAVFPLGVWGVRRYRAGYGRRLRSERLKRLSQTPIGKFARWLALGGEAKFEEQASRQPIRWSVLIALLLLYGLIYWISAQLVPLFAETLVTTPTALVLGSPVEVAQASFEPLSGRLTFDNFAVADPKRPTEDLLFVGKASLDLGLVGLLQRRAVINAASVEGVRLHVVREADGSLNLDNVGTGWDVDGYLSWLKENASRVDWIGLLKKLWTFWQRRPSRPEPRPQPDLSGAHRVPRLVPWFALERVGAERFELTLSDKYGGVSAFPRLSQAELVLENFELDPRLAQKPIVIALQGALTDMPGARLALSARFKPLGGGRFRSTFDLGLEEIDLTAFAPLYERTLPVRLARGTVTFTGQLTITPEALSGQTSVKLEGLQLARKPDQPALFGFDPLTSEAIVRGINRFAAQRPIEFSTRVSGTVQRPDFGWEAAFLQVAVEGLESQANVLLRPYIELIKAHLRAAGSTRGSLDPEQGLQEIRSLIEGFFQGQGG